ncbi:hypothetical protein BDF14DRAFT_1816456 [Spinellus fusiger]|nr:hypothetical protein BDF14DRAFT_1816456 [Spinellus fusiger]
MFCTTPLPTIMIQSSRPTRPLPPSHLYYPTTSSSIPPSLPGWRPLPSILIDFIAMTLCDLIPIKSTRRCSHMARRPLPELVYFIHKITYQAGINGRTALVALIYLHRAKQNLPANAVGKEDTCHRLFLGALLLASKFLQDTPWTPAYTHSFAATDLTLTATASRYHDCSTYIGPLTNRRLYEICNGIFNLQDICKLEISFLQLIHYHCWVDDKCFNTFVLCHRVDLSI